MPEISIIVPVYNTEKYLRRCIDSILAQTFNDFELILVDDGSPDNCGNICDEYAECDERIHVIHKVNGGVSSARNTGIEYSTGRYIMFCDSDDYLESKWCELLLQQIQNNPKSWCFCGCHCVNINNEYVETNCVLHKTPVFEVLPINQYDLIYRTNYSALLWIRIFDGDIIRNNNIRFDENISLSEDVLFNLHYGKYCDGFSIVNLPLYNHRVYHENEHIHLDQSAPPDFYINRKVYMARRHFIIPENIKEFETDFFYRFIDNIKGIAVNSSLNYSEKRKAIHQILSSAEFRNTIRFADTSKENRKFILILKLKLDRVLLRVLSKV